MESKGVNKDEKKTVFALMKWASDSLNLAGIEDSAFESRDIMMFVLDCSMPELLIKKSQILDEISIARFKKIVKKRMTHYPLQYILGSTGFMGFDFKCREGVLIPRFDTENLVVEALERTKSRKTITALDLCCGTGCIGISYELLRSEAGHDDDRVTCADISDFAIGLAKENVEKLNASVDIVQSDLFTQFEDTSFDLIMSNPPYIPTREIFKLMKDVRDFEPHLALDGNQDGLKFYRQIIDEAPDHLNKNGYLVLEIGYDQATAVETLMHRAGFSQIVCKKDLNGLDRVVSGKLM